MMFAAVNGLESVDKEYLIIKDGGRTWTHEYKLETTKCELLRYLVLIKEVPLMNGKNLMRRMGKEHLRLYN